MKVNVGNKIGFGRLYAITNKDGQNVAFVNDKNLSGIVGDGDKTKVITRNKSFNIDNPIGELQIKKIGKLDTKA